MVANSIPELLPHDTTVTITCSSLTRPPMLLFLAVVCLVVIGGAVYHTSKLRDESIAFRWGWGLIGSGLLSSLLLSYHPDWVNDQQTAFINNFFLITASVGANFIASSAILGKRRRETESLSDLIEHDESRDQPKPTSKDISTDQPTYLQEPGKDKVKEHV